MKIFLLLALGLFGGVQSYATDLSNDFTGRYIKDSWNRDQNYGNGQFQFRVRGPIFGFEDLKYNIRLRADTSKIGEVQSVPKNYYEFLKSQTSYRPIVNMLVREDESPSAFVKVVSVSDDGRSIDLELIHDLIHSTNYGVVKAQIAAVVRLQLAKNCELDNGFYDNDTNTYINTADECVKMPIQRVEVRSLSTTDVTGEEGTGLGAIADKAIGVALDLTLNFFGPFLSYIPRTLMKVKQ